jgi:NAD(P)-dependent dehydrogenase (short-subunit alcohol dehydrogenase family)
MNMAGARLLVATDAWEPQVNGVVRTLQATIRELVERGVEVEIVHPGRFSTLALPTYPDIRLAIVPPRRLKALIAESAPARRSASASPRAITRGSPNIFGPGRPCRKV